jgi:uncharacterized membrane protein YqgA involved in biofilm formation
MAGSLEPWLSAVLINQLTALGGALILGIGLNLLEIKAIKTMNLLPGLVVVTILTMIFL